MEPRFRAAAWAPWESGRGIGDSAELAAKWLTSGENRGLQPLLVSPDKGPWNGGPEVIEQWGKRNGTTPRGSRPVGPGPYAVLCYSPNFKTLALSQRYADEGAIAVVEWPTDPMIGWAMTVGAVNLRIGETAPTFDDDVREMLDFVSYVGNNGWAPGTGREAALSRIASYGWIEPNLVAGYMLALGHSPQSVEFLRTTLRKRS